MAKEETYIAIYDWMFKLDMSANELHVFALIYSFQQTTGKFYGSTSYMAEKLNCSKRTVIRALQELVDKGMLIRKPSGKQTYSYSVNELAIKLVTKCHRTGDKMSPETGDKMSPNNNTSYKTNYNSRARGNKFNNFNQRSYDFDSLESQLLK